jgi:hypothetical protein
MFNIRGMPGRSSLIVHQAGGGIKEAIRGNKAVYPEMKASVFLVIGLAAVYGRFEGDRE